MASTPPNWSITTTTKTYPNQLYPQNHQRRQPNNHQPRKSHRNPNSSLSHKFSTLPTPQYARGSTNAAASSSAATAVTCPLSFQRSSLEHFSGRQSTRIVSKRHLGRPKHTGDSNRSEFAVRALQNVVEYGCDDRMMETILLDYEPDLCGTDDYTYLLRELGNRGDYARAIKCFEFAVKRESGKTEQGKLASAMISTLGRLGKVDLANSVFETARKEGYGNTVYAYSAIISAYGKSGYADQAIRVFDSMRENGLFPNLVTYNAVIHACGIGGFEYGRVVEYYHDMLRNGVEPDSITFNTLLAVCSRGGLWETARDVFNEMVKRGINPDSITYNTLLDAACKGGQMDLASEIMAEMPYKPNNVTYSTMIDGFAKANRLDEALNLLREMKSMGVKLDRVSYNTLISIYTKLCRFDDAFYACAEMERSGISKDVVTYNALLTGYGKQCQFAEVRKLLEEMKSNRVSLNLLTYSTLMDVYLKGGLYTEALQVFKEFKKAGLKADVVLYTTTAEYALEQQTDSSTREDNRIVKIVGQLENAGLAKRDFEPGREILCILGVFHKMRELEIRPNVVTFSAILNACSRCNSFDDASTLLEDLRLFDNQVYGVAHGLLMGWAENAWLQAQSLLDQVNQVDSSSASAFYNALTDMLWHFGQKQGAQLVALEGRHRKVWDNVWTESCLDLHLMSCGAAQAMVHAWLLSIRTSVFKGQELPDLLSILTGWGKHSKVVGDSALRKSVGALLTGMGAPFRIAKCNLGRFISTGSVVDAWLRESGTLELLVLHDDRSPERVRLDRSNLNLQMVPA
ncbi:hypothetical protein ACFE04_018901 [Oxalis oulophora]